MWRLDWLQARLVLALWLLKSLLPLRARTHAHAFLSHRPATDHPQSQQKILGGRRGASRARPLPAHLLSHPYSVGPAFTYAAGGQRRAHPNPEPIHRPPMRFPVHRAAFKWGRIADGTSREGDPNTHLIAHGSQHPNCESSVRPHAEIASTPDHATSIQHGFGREICSTQH